MHNSLCSCCHLGAVCARGSRVKPTPWPAFHCLLPASIAMSPALRPEDARAIRIGLNPHCCLCAAVSSRFRGSHCRPRTGLRPRINRSVAQVEAARTTGTQCWFKSSPADAHRNSTPAMASSRGFLSPSPSQWRGRPPAAAGAMRVRVPPGCCVRNSHHFSHCSYVSPRTPGQATRSTLNSSTGHSAPGSRPVTADRYEAQQGLRLRSGALWCQPRPEQIFTAEAFSPSLKLSGP